MAQAAVTNAIKHGRAQQVKIALAASSRRIVITVSDNGAGLKKSADRRQGLGWRIMQHRASVMGGTLGLKENRHGGLDVICTVEKPDAPKAEPCE